MYSTILICKIWCSPYQSISEKNVFPSLPSFISLNSTLCATIVRVSNSIALVFDLIGLHRDTRSSGNGDGTLDKRPAAIGNRKWRTKSPAATIRSTSTFSLISRLLSNCWTRPFSNSSLILVSFFFSF